MKRLFSIIILFACVIVVACAQVETKLEAEKASFSNCQLVNDPKYSGGKALELTEANAQIEFTFNAPQNGKYMITVGYDGLYGEKVVALSVNGNIGTFNTTVKGLGEAAVGPFFLNQGENSIVITPTWTWFRIDYIRITSWQSSVQFDISKTPVDAKATEAAKKMYAFLLENFGKKTISGIMTGDMATANGDVTQHADVVAVYQASGKYPALIGFDFMNATGDAWSREYTRKAVELAKDTWRRGGLPNFTWHWRDPSRKTGEFYTDKSQVKISDALNADGSWKTSSQLYKNIISDIDLVADYFLELQKEGMACMFRPLHESAGGWFWWGREGAANCVKLYQLLFHEMVNVKGVHNVIWIWNAAPEDAAWNPGDDKFDVVSADIYNAADDYSSSYVTFDGLKTLTKGKKIIALSENGPIPDIDKEEGEEAMWSWWMPWYQTWGGNFVNQTSKDEWMKCMNDPRVVTLEDLSAGWNTETSIDGVVSDSQSSMRKGIFTLDGRLVEKPLHGIYIKDGKKVWVR